MMEHYCGRHEEVGHGSSAVCGNIFYTEVHQCDKCKLKDANNINKELASIIRELCLAYNHPLPEASLKRSDAAIVKAEGK